MAANKSSKGAAKQDKVLPVNPREAVNVYLRDKDESHDVATARELTRPAVSAAVTIYRVHGDGYDVNALANELQRQVDAVNNGDMKRPEAMLIAQAHILDELFNRHARIAIRQDRLLQCEANFRIALKAQAQCRATLETLAAIKNPPIVFAKQANIANGPQQVNNGISASTRTQEKEINPTKLSEGGNELLPYTRAPAIEGRVNQKVEAVGAVNRTKDKGRKRKGIAKRL